MLPLYRDGSQEATVERARLINAALGAGLAAAALALAVFVWLGYLIRAGEPTAFDLTIRAAVRSIQHPTLSKVMVAASVYGAPSLLAPFGAIAAGVFYARDWRRAAVLTLVTIGGALVLNVGFKWLFGRARPEAFFDYYPAPVSYSFPSGHALFATCFFGGIAVLASHRVRGLTARVVLWVGAVVLILLIGLSRIYLGVHYPTDVVGGVAVGMVWVGAVALGDRLAERRRLRV